MKIQSSKLSTLVAAVALFVALPVHAQLIPAGAVWKYWDNGQLPDPNWAAPGYDDAAWAAGAAELGFGDGGETTVVASGSLAYYFRTPFAVADASSITNLRVRLKRDDGAIVYINGVEVVRDNMPAGPVDATTLAATTASDDGSTFQVHSFAASGLVNGDNTIAVEVHQVNSTSSDISFDLELTANPLPSIAITSPTNGQAIASATIPISGLALPGGSNITSIQLFANGINVGSSTSSSFAVGWQNANPGSYTLTATIVDSSGLTATSAPVSMQVQAPPASLLIPRASSWKYKSGTDLTGSGWETSGYNDSAWSGPLPGPLGDNNESGTQLCTSVIDIGSPTRYPVVYYRKTFNVTGA